jgi:DNA-binding beta-propeller fold protein YncE
MMRKPRRNFIVSLAALCGLVPMAFGGTVPNYHVTRTLPLAGDDFWDYLSFDAPTARLYVAHGTRVQVVDTHDFTVVGEIPDTPGVHGVALARDLGRGYVSAGRSSKVVVFDLKSLARITEIATTGEGPDAILYDGSTRRVLTFNGRGRNATVIDAKNNTVVATIPLDAKPEFAVADGSGLVYVNLEDRNSLAVIDVRAARVEKVWPLTGCESPTGLALDRAHHRLFSVCSNQTMVVLDAASGRAVASLPIGAHVDGAAFDEGTGLAFASAGDGTLTVVREENPDHFVKVQTVATRLGARTLALDPTTHRVFTVTAALRGPAPATAAEPHPRPTIEPRSFELLEISP